jgi:hypothetical protein
MAFRLSVSPALRTKRSFLSDHIASPPTPGRLPPEGLVTLHKGQLGNIEGFPESGLLEYEIFASGCHRVTTLTCPLLRIIAVHGLNGHRENSWIHTNGETGEQTLWLRDLLPPCIPNSRISTFGYIFNGDSAAELKEKAIRLLDEICNLEMPKEGQVWPCCLN